MLHPSYTHTHDTTIWYRAVFTESSFPKFNTLQWKRCNGSIPQQVMRTSTVKPELGSILQHCRWISGHWYYNAPQDTSWLALKRHQRMRFFSPYQHIIRRENGKDKETPISHSQIPSRVIPPAVTARATLSAGDRIEWPWVEKWQEESWKRHGCACRKPLKSVLEADCERNVKVKAHIYSYL